MHWLLENIQVVIAVAGIIAYYINQRRRQKQGLPTQDEEGNPLDAGSQPTAYDPATMEAEEAARTRQLMEEMRRKRAEREGRVLPEEATAPVSAPATAPKPRLDAPPPIFPTQDPLTELVKDVARRVAPAPEPAPEQPPGYLVDGAALVRQQDLETQLKALEEQRYLALKRAETIRKEEADAKAPVEQDPRDASWATQMHSVEGVRRAIIMSEILGKPVGLR